jgi:CBS domain-containing protein
VIPVLDRIIVHEGTAGAAQEPGARILGLVDERDLARAVLPVLTRAEALRQAPQYASETVLAGPPLPHAVESAVVTGAPDVTNMPGMNGHHVNGSVNGHPTPAGASLSSEERLESLKAQDVMRSDISFVPAAFSLHNALLTMDRYNSLALPVVDEAGNFRGMISRADVVAALGGHIRPPMVGGMATPLGVWLTTGRISAGAPPLGLFLSGLVMSLCFMVVNLVMQLGLSAINQEWAILYASGRLGALSEGGGGLNFAMAAVQSLLFLGFFRLLPMAGIHAAEHQTVWAIERGLPLVPEVVEKMPRAHPRCGTNLMALASLIIIIFQHLPVINANTVLLTLLFVYLTWRNFGEFLQEWFTTRPATRQQLESGIRAGRGILETYQQQPHVSVAFGTGLLNSGLALSVLGMMTGFGLLMGLGVVLSKLFGIQPLIFS